MKKVLLLFLLSIVALSLVVGSVSAKPKSTTKPGIPEGFALVKEYDDADVTAFQSNKANDEKMKKVRMGVNPQVTTKNSNKDAKIKIVKNEVRPVYDLKNTTTGETVTMYANDVDMGIIMPATTTENKSTDGYDSTYGVHLTVTVYSTLSGTSETLKAMTKVDWNYQISDSTLRIKSWNHYFIQSGPTSSGAVNQDKTLHPTTLSGSDLVSSWGWVPVDTYGTIFHVGEDFTDTIGTTYDSSSWTIHVVCMWSNVVIGP